MDNVVLLDRHMIDVIVTGESKQVFNEITFEYDSIPFVNYSICGILFPVKKNELVSVTDMLILADFKLITKADLDVNNILVIKGTNFEIVEKRDYVFTGLADTNWYYIKKRR